MGSSDTGKLANRNDEIIKLSVIIPAYNESKRLPDYLDTLKEYFCNENMNAYEVIVIDDGSTDDLEYNLINFKAHWSQFVYIKHPSNKGKGAAVRTGVLASKGKYILFTDADGATPIHFEKTFRKLIDEGNDIVIGSRRSTSPKNKCQRTLLRKLISRSFSTLVRLIVKLDTKDTQCGFKMFQNKVGHKLFNISNSNGYLFDIEILILAKHLKYRVVECPIVWSEKPGSNIRILFDSYFIFIDLLKLRNTVSTILKNNTFKSPPENS